MKSEHSKIGAYMMGACAMGAYLIDICPIGACPHSLQHLHDVKLWKQISCSDNE